MHLNPINAHPPDAVSVNPIATGDESKPAPASWPTDTRQEDDTVAKFGGWVRQIGRVQFDPSGVYRVVATGARSESAPAPSAGAGPDAAVGAETASAARARMQDVLNALGLDQRSARDVELSAELIQTLDPAAFESLLRRLQGVSEVFSKPEPRRSESTGAAAAAAPTARVDHLVVELTVSATGTDNQAQEEGSANAGARRYAFQFKNLDLSLTSAEGDAARIEIGERTA